MILDRLGLWPARVLWLVMPAVIGTGLTPALEGKASTPSLVVEVLLWVAWFIVLVSVLAPSPRSLTIVRIAGPAAVGVGLLCGLTTGWSATSVAAIGFASLFAAVIFLPTFGDLMINGSAYGSERRMALRPTAPVLLGPLQLAWLLVFAGLAVPPILLLEEWYVAAILAALVGWPVVWAGSRVLHQLSRRWIVFVPAGFVIHDPLQVLDSVLFRRNEVTALGPALAGAGGRAWSDSDQSTRIDLSGGSLGLALEIELVDPTPIALRRRGHIATVEADNIVFSPTLPGAMLSESRIRGMKIGEASGTAGS